ncbi:MAG: acyl-CoA dehydrogenase [Deltaproteobacteria bacterium]|nr:acyl-CoA dehydrogenase [Deltaproteobacteria bacterium]
MTRNLEELAGAEERRIAVREAAADFLRREWSLSSLRACIEGDGLADAPALWEGMRRLGWHEIDPFAAESEGSLGATQLCAIAEETGRALAPTPLVPCVVGRAILRGTQMARFSELAILAHGEGERTSDRLRTSAVAVEADGGFRLTGEKRFVPYGREAERLIVGATTRDGAFGLYEVEAETTGVDRRALRLLDGSPCAEIRLRDVDAKPIARDDEARRVLRDALSLETIARCAELVGVADRALELAVEYAKTRVAFDRPIGSFQAIQHRLVNLRAHVEVARALCQGAARASGEERSALASMAAFAALDDLRKVPEGALQVFGGIGTTWEHDIHLFLRRAATLTALLGERSGFREDVVRHLEETLA